MRKLSAAAVVSTNAIVAIHAAMCQRNTIRSARNAARHAARDAVSEALYVDIQVNVVMPFHAIEAIDSTTHAAVHEEIMFAAHAIFTSIELRNSLPR